ncbi:MAG: SusC/RagA family TonB-linked outer membrane protein [Parafilimonas sp.]|nr:SusC/RagA family TonB-linked outer membrane protein [Parafilimonas sp.]
MSFTLFLICGATTFAQKVVSGVVTDSASRSPLPGVTVTVKGTKTGTQTSNDGRFSITVPNNATTLFISSVGYGSKEVPIGTESLSISLVQSNASLNEVVVIGYGTARKKDLTGSVAIVNSKDFNKGVITTPEQLISGKVAGVSVTPNNGAPGSGSTIRIRGGSSLIASNDPLIVVDGMPLTNSSIPGVANQLSLINPNDIASFSILKDASATAIYGSRAANGVILITTKKGQQGKPKFTFTTQLSAGTLIKEYPVLSTDQFRELVNTYGTADQIALMGDANTDWQKEIYHTAITSDNNLSISGALKNLPYRLSVGYLDQNGILKTGYLHRISTELNLNPVLLDNHLKIDISIKGSFSKSRFANNDAVGGATSFDPTQPVYSGSDRYGGYWERLDPANTVTGLASLSPKNPVGLLEQKFDIGNAERLIANAAIDYKFHFFPALHAIANIGYDYSKGYGNVTINDSAAMAYMGFKAKDSTLHGGQRSHYQTNMNNLFTNFYLNYSTNINTKNRIEALAGIEYQDYLTTNFGFNTYAYDTAVTSTPKYPFDKPENRLLSFLGRVNYSYNDIFYLTASFRRDGSSKFAPAFRWGNFPSGAVAFNIRNMGDLRNSQVLSNLKLRVGYGVVGQQDGIGDYDYISYYDLSDVKAQYQFGNTFYQMYRPGGYYANRKWEQTATSNVAIDYGFFNERISGSLEFYYKKTTDLLNQITQPAFTNFSNTIVANVGSMTNKGVEFTVNAEPVRTNDISWTVSFNATYNKNEITKLTINDIPNFVAQVAGIGGNGGLQANAVGYPRGSFYVFKQVYDEKTGKPIEDLFVDLNNDGKINTSDLYIFKSPDPKMFYGFSSNFNYRKWSASFSMRANVGNYVYNGSATNGAISKFLFSSFLANENSDVLNTNFKGLGDYYQSNYYIQNASFIKMDYLNIGYNLGRLNNSNIGLRFNAGVQNVFTITKYTGIDPEIDGGVDFSQYPRPRTFLLEVGVDF